MSPGDVSSRQEEETHLQLAPVGCPAPLKGCCFPWGQGGHRHSQHPSPGSCPSHSLYSQHFGAAFKHPSTLQRPRSALTCLPLVRNELPVGQRHENLVIQVPEREKNPLIPGCRALISHPKPPCYGHPEPKIHRPRLQDAHDGSSVLHLHAVLPVTDVVRGLVHMDATGEEESLRLTWSQGPPYMCPPVLGTYQPSSVPNHIEL